jgi:hypothetical protein
MSPMAHAPWSTHAKTLVRISHSQTLPGHLANRCTHAHSLPLSLSRPLSHSCRHPSVRAVQQPIAHVKLFPLDFAKCDCISHPFPSW